MTINNYIIQENEEGYVIGYYATNDNEYDYRGQMAQYPEVCEGWYKFENNEFIVDEVKKAEILEERAKQSTEMEKIEAQLLYTAMMTDTLLEEV